MGAALPDFTIKQGDSVPILQCTLSAGGVAQDLTGATVTFSMRLSGYTGVAPGSVLNQPATVLSPATNGVVTFAFTSAQTALPGTYEGEFHVTFASGAKGTWPDPGKLAIVVEGRVQ